MTFVFANIVFLKVYQLTFEECVWKSREQFGQTPNHGLWPRDAPIEKMIPKLKKQSYFQVTEY